MRSGIQTLEERLGRLRDLASRVAGEIELLEARQADALQLAAKARREQLAAALAAKAPADKVRAWAKAAGYPIGDRGRVSAELRKAFLEAAGDLDSSNGSVTSAGEPAPVRHHDQGRDSAGTDQRSVDQLETEVAGCACPPGDPYHVEVRPRRRADA